MPFNIIDILATLVKDKRTNTRRFTVKAQRKGKEDNTIYVWNNATTFLAVTVDWTQSGMREIYHEIALNRIEYFEY